MGRLFSEMEEGGTGVEHGRAQWAYVRSTNTRNDPERNPCADRGLPVHITLKQ